VKGREADKEKKGEKRDRCNRTDLLKSKKEMWNGELKEREKRWDKGSEKRRQRKREREKERRKKG
jgi:hypothetical protein